MSISTLPSDELFRTAPELGLPAAARVDDKSRTIFGAKAMQIGPLNAGDSRPWKVDSTTLSQLEQLVNRRNLGIKSRFAHPNMSSDGMGRHLGRASNARRVADPEGDYTAVDLALSDAATRGPKGNLAQHVLDLAKETPEDFGLSIAPILDREAMGKIEPDEQGLVPIRLKDLRAIDVVDEPAATRGGMFSLDSDSLADLPAQASHLLDTFFADCPAEVIRARFGSFLETYLRNRGDDEMSTETQPNAELEAVRKENDALKTQVADLTKRVDELSKATPPADVESAKAKAELAKLAQKGEIEALCKLAKVDDATKDLILKAGFSRVEAQAWLKESGHLSAINPPIPEGGKDPIPEPSKPEDKFAAEFEANKDVFALQGLTKEQYIKSRLKDAA